MCIGPVDASAAVLWTEHELRNLQSLRANVTLLPFAVPPDVLDEIEGYVRQWRFVARSQPTFSWSALISRARLALLVRYWANLDLLSDDEVARLGLRWAPLSTRPFFDAVVAAVDTALRSDGAAPDPFARLLAR